MIKSAICPITTPTEMLADAKKLAEDPAQLSLSSRQRTVISRCYYAAFHAVSFRFPFKSDPSQRGGMHRQFISMLRGSDENLAKHLGARLKGLYARRLIADYEPTGIVTAQIALDSLQDAEEIIIDLLELEADAADAKPA